MVIQGNHATQSERGDVSKRSVLARTPAHAKSIESWDVTRVSLRVCNPAPAFRIAIAIRLGR
jgi:hypothetical protein